MSLETRVFEQIFKEVERLDNYILIKILEMLDYRMQDCCEERYYEIEDLFTPEELNKPDEDVIGDYMKKNPCPNEGKCFNFKDYLGIDYEFSEGLFGSGKLGIYNVNRHAYENKNYNMNDDDRYTFRYEFDKYEKSLESIFKKYEKVTGLDYYSIIGEFEEMFKNSLVS